VARARPDVPIGSSIRVVARRTGLGPATLRVWERRYGFPVPERRPGGSRVYSEGDVARLQLVARALAAGFRPGEVVPLPPAEIEKLVDAASQDAKPARATEHTVPSAIGVADILGALLADDADGVRARLRSVAVALGPRQFVVSVAHPLMVRVGDLWAEGKLDVRHEHLATACVSTQLRLLLGALDEGAGGSPTVLLATLPHEAHALALEMIAVYLAAGHAVPRILGADTPPDQIVAAARALDADAVGLSIPRGGGAKHAPAQLREIRKGLPPHVALWIGGGGASAVAPAGEPIRVARSFADVDDLLGEARKQRLAMARSG
jgi:DNA-binding transcriptional MerR regulator/methylmalonyl-CoA mutase cobalamin-binding subunit